jgi:hypothetical protein
MLRPLAIASVLILASSALTGCDTTGSATSNLVDTRPLASSLVTGGAVSAGSSTDWTVARNDGLLGNTMQPPVDELAVVTTFGRDRMRTITGKAIDTSSTETYSFRRRLVP